jgi:hypothetical protein
MGWFEDVCDWVETAVEDVGEALGDAAEAVGDAVVEAVEWVGDAVVNVGEAIGATVVGAVETIGDLGEAIGDTLSGRDPIETWNEFGMNALDNMVFDPVDYLTGGDVNLDYDDGAFTADVDLNLGIGAVGLHVGEAGFDASASFDIGIASGSVSLDSSAGFAATGSIGIADGPWPYAEGHLSISPDGGVLIGGELQATLPLPGGYVSVGLDGEMELNPDGSFGVQGSFDTVVDGPMGTGGSLHVDGHAEVDPFDMSAGFGGNIDAEGTGPGGAHVGAHAGFDAGLDDGRLETTVEAGVEAGLAGAELDAGFETTVGVGAGGPAIAVDRWADLDLPDAAGGPDIALGLPGAASSGAALEGGGDQSSFDDPFAAGAVDFGASMQEVEVPQVELPPEPEPQQDDFSQQIEVVDQMVDKADEMWDDIGQ